MTYGTLYIDGNFLGFYDRREDAEADVLEVVEHDPTLAAEYGYFAFNEQGERVGEFVTGAELLAKRGAGAAA
jgi:hypothetical protein